MSGFFGEKKGGKRGRKRGEGRNQQGHCNWLLGITKWEKEGKGRREKREGWNLKGKFYTVSPQNKTIFACYSFLSKTCGFNVSPFFLTACHFPLGKKLLKSWSGQSVFLPRVSRHQTISITRKCTFFLKKERKPFPTSLYLGIRTRRRRRRFFLLLRLSFLRRKFFPPLAANQAFLNSFSSFSSSFSRLPSHPLMDKNTGLPPSSFWLKTWPGMGFTRSAFTPNNDMFCG